MNHSCSLCRHSSFAGLLLKECKNIIAAVVFVTSLIACDTTPKFTVEGDVKGAQDSILYFYNMSLNGPVVLDSARLDADGHFSFQGDAPEAPDFYVLRIDNQVINVSIDSTETVTIHAHYPGMASNYEVEGSDNCEKIRELALKHQQLQEAVYALERNTSLTAPVMADSLERLITDYKDDVRTNYIYAAPDRSYAYFALIQALYHLYWNPQTIFTRDDPADIRAFAAVATCWDTFHPEAQRTLHLHNTALRGMNERRQAVARDQMTIDEDKITVTGIIDLQLEDNHGQQRTLSELRGKVVLLDFNIFEAPESGPRILQLRKLYDKYHAQGLEIYQVSPDEDIHLWRQATESLPWISVHDATGLSFSRYNVQAVPEFFLIDRESQLYKRSVQMDDIEAEIRSLL